MGYNFKVTDAAEVDVQNHGTVMSQQSINWRVLDCVNGIRTSEAVLDSPYGLASVRRYENLRHSDHLHYVGVVVIGNSVTDSHFGGNLEGAVTFTQHPFRAINPADYWNGLELQERR